MKKEWLRLKVWAIVRSAMAEDFIFPLLRNTICRKCLIVLIAMAQEAFPAGAQTTNTEKNPVSLID